MKLSSLTLKMVLGFLLIIATNLANAKLFFWSVPSYGVDNIVGNMMWAYEAPNVYDEPGDNLIMISSTIGGKFHIISDNTQNTNHVKLQKMREIYRSNLTSDEVVKELRSIFEDVAIDYSLFEDGRELEIIHDRTSWTIYKFTPRSL